MQYDGLHVIIIIIIIIIIAAARDKLKSGRNSKNRSPVLSSYQEKIPSRNAIYAHAQDFAASDELLLAILKAFFSTITEQTTDNRLSCVLMNSL
jgi:hypothetical protein